ncbi:MAG: hypothetical protein N4A35_09670 [Flavobacteriales bacterium]|jgi:hypothetical protein|nr:hypothetical protein [Flavobacteriales bacterium]
MSRIFFILFIFSSFSLFSQIKRERSRLLTKTNTICSLDSTNCRNILNIRKGKKNITVIYDTLNRVYFVNEDFCKGRKYKITYVREGDNTFEYHVKESKNGKIKEHFLFKNNKLWVEGKSINNYRVKTWKQYSLEENSLVGKVRFVLPTKNKKNRENCPSAFSCSEIKSFEGITDGILSEYW